MTSVNEKESISNISKTRMSEKNKDLCTSAKVDRFSETPHGLERNLTAKASERESLGAKFNKELSAKVEYKPAFKSEFTAKSDKNTEANNNLKVESKISVKDLTKTLSMANLQFRPPGMERPKLPKVDETPENDKKEPVPLNSDFNDVSVFNVFFIIIFHAR